MQEITEELQDSDGFVDFSDQKKTTDLLVLKN